MAIVFACFDDQESCRYLHEVVKSRFRNRAGW
jgi:hypothetical protein